MSQNIIISGVGCALIDNIYNNISFESPEFQKYISIKPGDGGLSPGKLVFTEEFEQFAGTSFQHVLSEITKNKTADVQNIGGPCLVALINAAQMSFDKNIEVRFFGARGDDLNGSKLEAMLEGMPLDLSAYRVMKQTTPFTDVFSDPDFNKGEGERIFVNNIGTAWNIKPDDLNADFFKADIQVYGGTALVPNIHDHLDILLAKSKKAGALTIVNTVYDFRNEKKNPNARWPLGSSDKAYSFIDCLITDHEEALRLSGKPNQNEAMQFFLSLGVNSCIITNGANSVSVAAKSTPFQLLEPTTIPVSELVKKELAKGVSSGDTTGCGDNFVGGVIASLAGQKTENKKPDILEATSWGIASGGFACFYMGGTYNESSLGEKKRKIAPIIRAYQKQISSL
mgnify:CR=1 FL=1